MGTLTGKVALVTGGSRGLGRAVAEQLIRDGACVVICARSMVEVNSASEDIYTATGGEVYALGPVDVGNEADVSAAVAMASGIHSCLDILVCCAGIQGEIGRFDSIEVPAWRDVLRTNLIGTMLCCREVIPIMRKQHYGKIIALSGGGATKPYPNFAAYAASKAGVVGFIATLAEELKNDGIDAVSVAPGALNTTMLDEVLAAGPRVIGAEAYERALKQQQLDGDATMDNAAKLIAYLASGACDGISGRLISAVWDDWLTLPRQELGDDLYTMRRVV